MQNRIKQAVILSAGFGTRLRPMTDNIPKVMVPFSGKPLLQWHVEQLKKHGVEEFFINLFYLPEVIKNHFGDGSKFGVKINYFLEEPEILGTAGGMKDFQGKLHGDFFLIYGDIFSLVDYSKMAEAFYRKEVAIGMELVGNTNHPRDSDLAEVDDNLRFLKIHPKPHKELPACFALRSMAGGPPKYKSMRGVYIFNERILEYIPENRYYEIDHNLLPNILEKNEKFYGYETKDYLKDIGTIDRYEEVQKYYKSLC